MKSMQTPRTLLKIQQEYPSFHGNYIRIAARILENPSVVIRDKVADAAAACGCDNAQIIRFCQKLGFKGFSDMKQALIHDLIPFHTKVGSSELDRKTGFQRLVQDVRTGYQRTVNDTFAVFDEDEFLKTAAAVRQAGRIMICGMGASGIVGEDLQMKLSRMGYPVCCHGDPMTRRMLCALLTGKDLLIAISFRGQNSEVLDCVKIARANGCRIAAITNGRTSPLAEMSDLMLLTAAEEDDFRIGAMTSRFAQLMVVDFLSVIIASKDQKAGRSLAKTYAVLDRAAKTSNSQKENKR